jgi:pyruvate kinase
MNLIWGVCPFLARFYKHVDEMLCDSAEFLYKRGLVNEKDIIILTAGEPVSVSGSTNMMEIREIKSLLDQKKSFLDKKRK